MKKVTILKTMLAICIIAVVALSGVGLYDYSKSTLDTTAITQNRSGATTTVPIQSSPQKNNTVIIGEASYMVDFNTIDDVVKYSSNVIVGTVLREEEDSEYSSMYVVSVEKNIKGTVESSDIDVCETKGSLQVGKKYILFLGYFDTTFRTRGVYTSEYKDCIIMVDNDKLISKNKFGEDKHGYSEFIKMLEKSSGLSYKRDKKFNIKDQAGSLKELIEYSDHIIHLIPDDIIKCNKDVVMAQCDIVKHYKGYIDTSGGQRFLLPSYVEKGKEYIVFLKDSDGSSSLSTRKGSVICKDDANEWDKVIKELNK